MDQFDVALGLLLEGLDQFVALVVARWLGHEPVTIRSVRQLAVDLATGALAFVEHDDPQTCCRKLRRRGHAAGPGTDDANVGLDRAVVTHSLPPRCTFMPDRTIVVHERTVAPSTTTRHS